MVLTLARGKLAEEPDDARQPAVLGQVGDVDALDGDGAVGTDQLPREARVLVVHVDAAGALEGMAVVVLVHDGGHLADAVVALARSWRQRRAAPASRR